MTNQFGAFRVTLPQGVSYEVYPGVPAVVTVLPNGIDGKRLVGTREATPQNVAEARRQGYQGTDEEVCFLSLLEHEALHIVVAHVLWNELSPVMRDVAGEPTPYDVRLLEEGVAIGLQRILNYAGDGRLGPALAYEIQKPLLDKAWALRLEFRDQLLPYGIDLPRPPRS
jgi:hypothetical protein